MPEKKEKETSLLSPEMMEQLRQASGERDVYIGQYQFPSLSVEHKEEIFVKLVKDKDGKYDKIHFSKTIKGIILKIRKKLYSWEGESGGYSFEFDSSKEKITFFEKGVPLSEGTANEIKKEMVNMKIKELNVLYVLIEKEIFKLPVKGKSLSQFFEFLKNKGTDPLASFYTEFSLIKQKKGSIEFCMIVFKKVEYIEHPQEVLEKITELNRYVQGLRILFSQKKDENKTETDITDDELEEIFGGGKK